MGKSARADAVMHMTRRDLIGITAAATASYPFAPAPNPDTAFAPPFIGEMRGASSLGVNVVSGAVHSDAEIERVFADSRGPMR